MTATFHVTGDINDLLGGAAGKATAFVAASVPAIVSSGTGTPVFTKSAVFRVTNGVVSIDLPAWDPTNLPYSSAGAQFGFTLFIGTQKWQFMARAAGTTLDLSTVTGTIAGPLSPSLMDQATALLGQTQQARTDAQTAATAAQAVGTTNDTVIAGRINAAGSATQVALSAALVAQINTQAVPRWQPFTAYVAGQLVTAPDGTLVRSKANFTSGATYNPTSWTAADGPVKARNDAVRRSYPHAVTRVPLPVLAQAGTTSAALTTSGAITSLPVTALAGAISEGVVTITGGGNTQGFYTPGAAAGATSIPVQSTTPAYAFASGATVSYGFAWPTTAAQPIVYSDGKVYTTDFDPATYKNTGGATWYVDSVNGKSTNTGKAVATLTTPLAAGAAVTSLAVSATTAAVAVNDTLVLFSGAVSQAFTVTTAAAAGATTIAVASVTPTQALPVGSTVTSPAQSLNKFASLSAANDTAVLLDRATNTQKGLIYRGGSWQGTLITKSCNVIAQFPGEVKYVMGDALTWTATSGQPGVFQAARSNVLKFVDLALGPVQNGAPIGAEYDKVTSLALCAATPRSWYTDGTTLYVNTGTGLTPDNTRHIALLNQSYWIANSAAGSTDVTLYLEGFDLVGGVAGNILAQQTTGTSRVNLVTKNVRGLSSTGTDGTGNAINFISSGFCYSRNTLLVNAEKDGFNYTPYTVGGVYFPGVAIEVDALSHSHGLKNAIAGSENTNNASTAHGGFKVIRINGVYSNTTGAVLAEVHVGTQSVAYGSVAFDSKSTDPNYHQSVAAQQPGTEMWLFGCRGFGSTADIYAASGATVRATATDADSYGGSGKLILAA